MESLIHCGHDPQQIWEYSPRQAYAFIILASHRHKEEDCRQMVDVFYGSNADGKKLDELRKDLLKGF